MQSLPQTQPPPNIAHDPRLDRFIARPSMRLCRCHPSAYANTVSYSLAAGAALLNAVLHILRAPASRSR